MKKLLLVLNILTICLQGYCQIMPEDKFFDGYYFDNDIHSPTYKEYFQSVKRNNIKTIIIWDSKDSLGANKQKYCKMEFNKNHKIINESYFEENKIVPYEKYKYLGNKKIVKEFNADNQYWITYEMNINDKGQIETINIKGGKCYNIVINYKYNDSLIVKKEIIDSSCDMNLEGEGTTIFHYDSLKRIIKIENITTNDIEQFKYDSTGFLCGYVKNKGNTDWENQIINYSYTGNKLTKKVSESFNSGRKDEKKIIETYYIYNSKGLLEKEIVKDFRNNKTSIRVYKHNNDGLLILTGWTYPDDIQKNNYHLYSYESY